MDACYASVESKRWEPVEVEWRDSGSSKRLRAEASEYDGKVVIKEEKMPDGRFKRILKDKETGEITENVSM